MDGSRTGWSAVDAPGRPPEAAPRPYEPPPHWRTRHLPRILIVDDEPDIRDSLRQALEASLRADVVAVGDAPAARRLLAGGSCDVVLLDQVLPGAEGSTLLAWMSQQRLLARTIVITALPAATLPEPPLLLRGASAVFRKPLDLPGLLAAIRGLAPTTAAPARPVA